MFGLVVLLESVVGRENLDRNDKVVWGWVQGPEVSTEHHYTEGDVHIVVILRHAVLEGIGKIFA